MSNLLYKLTNYLPCRIISDDGQHYLERYYLFTILGVRFYLHRFVGSDPARGLHDHPWPWAGSVILSGWYTEETRQGLRAIRWFNWIKGDSFHRVILPHDIRAMSFAPDNPITDCCWTLFFHRAKYTKPWGFLRKIDYETTHIWIPHNYQGDGTGTPDAWWETVPMGKDEPRRMAL